MSETLLCIMYMVIIAGVLTGIYATAKVLKIKYNNDLLNDAIDAVLDATDVVSQTYVDALKGKDEFSKECQDEALRKATEKAISLMPIKAQEYINKHSGDLTNWIESKIESYLWRSSGKAQLNSLPMIESVTEDNIEYCESDDSES